jgi:hypothetical protein
VAMWREWCWVGVRAAGCSTTTDNDGIMAVGVAYAEPPRVVPSTILDGGKGTSVSGCCPGPFVSGVIAGGFRP